MQGESDSRPPALLLLGSTGSGKTPMGDSLAEKGLCGRRCHHFDFGENLRQIASGSTSSHGLTFADVDVVRESVRTGALLADRQFHIARGIFTGFVANNGIGRQDIVVLNGLPRHTEQARRMHGIVDLRLVVCLECDLDTVLERIRNNTGGDRADRDDDDPDFVRKKLALYRQRTLPLVEYYNSTGIPVVRIKVQPQTTAGELVDRLASVVPAALQPE